jgi:hypothetical protein
VGSGREPVAHTKEILVMYLFDNCDYQVELNKEVL